MPVNTRFLITNQLLYQLSYAGKMHGVRLAHAVAASKLRTH